MTGQTAIGMVATILALLALVLHFAPQIANW
jgi:hypothetical protein